MALSVLYLHVYLAFRDAPIWIIHRDYEENLSILSKIYTTASHLQLVHINVIAQKISYRDGLSRSDVHFIRKKWSKLRSL